MADLNEILEQLDEEQAQAIRQAMADKDRSLKLKDRDLSLATSEKYKTLYPRAWQAYKKGRIKLGEETDEDAILAVLKEKEEEYVEMGVGLPDDHPAAAPKGEEPPPAKEPAPTDGSAAFGKTVAPPATPQVQDLVTQAEQALAGSTQVEREKFTELLFEMTPEQRGYFAKKLSAPPIRSKHDPIIV